MMVAGQASLYALVCVVSYFCIIATIAKEKNYGRHRKTSKAGSGDSSRSSGAGTITFPFVPSPALYPPAPAGASSVSGGLTTKMLQVQLAAMQNYQPTPVQQMQQYQALHNQLIADFEKAEPLPALTYETKFGEIIAYRFWHLHAGFLKSASAHNVWMPNEIEGLMEGQKIEDYGSAGVHAFKKEKDCILQAYPGDLVFGRVKLWGEVIEYERGYHAEFAKIIGLDHIHLQSQGYSDVGDLMLARLRAKYGVSVPA